MEQAVGGWRKGPWTPQEDKLLIQYITDYGEGRWSSVSKCTGLKRSGKSCRLRWVNYLRPGLKKGHLTPQEEGIIIELHALWGNKWSTIARYLPGRTDNEIKNYWRTHFKTKKQEKRKIFLKQQQQQQQQESETGSAASASASASAYEMSESPQVQNSKEDEAIAIPSIDDDEFWSKVYEESAASEFIPMDCYLWDGLWNLDCDNGVQNVCSKMGMGMGKGVDQNQAYYNPFEGDAVGDFLLSGNC